MADAGPAPGEPVGRFGGHGVENHGRGVGDTPAVHPAQALPAGEFAVLAPEDVYGGGVNRPIVMVELKLPNIGLGTVADRAAFIKAATDVVDELTVDGHARQDTWVNILNALDGAWGIGGDALTGEALVARIAGIAGVAGV